MTPEENLFQKREVKTSTWKKINVKKTRMVQGEKNFPQICINSKTDKRTYCIQEIRIGSYFKNRGKTLRPPKKRTLEIKIIMVERQKKFNRQVRG